MESKANYTIVGISVVGLIMGLLIISLWLSVGFDRKVYHFYTVNMEESVAGLNEESLVRYNGVKVGFVDKIELSPFDPEAVKLTLKIEVGTPIYASTRATLVTQGITGANYLGLFAVSHDKIPLKKRPNEPYPEITYDPSFLTQLQKTVTELSRSMKQLLNEDNSRNLKMTLNNLQRITTVFANNEKALNDTLSQMPALAQELKISIAHFSDMSHDVSAAGKQLNATMRSGKDAIDVISQQAVPPAVSLLHRLDMIAANIEQVSAQMRLNPAILIRGSSPSKKGPGE